MNDLLIKTMKCVNLKNISMRASNIQSRYRNLKKKEKK